MALTLLCAAPGLGVAGESQTSTLEGVVLDLRTHEPLTHVLVAIRSQDRTGSTDERGHFSLTGLSPGDIEVYVSSVGYGVAKKQIGLKPGAVSNLEISLGQEAIKAMPAVLEEVVVSARPFAAPDSSAMSAYTLDNTELQNLSTVLANDPFRAVANLPGVTANNDFYSQFAVRGAGMSHIGVVIDGVTVNQPLHGFTDSGDLGSVSIVNGDAVGSMALISGTFPVKYGDRTGAILDVETRDGDRDHVSTRLDANFLGASGTVEGPIGSERKGSWLVSVRESYLNYLTSKLNANGLALGYGDVATKWNYRLNDSNELSMTTLLGYSKATRDPVTVANQSQGFFTRATGGTDLSTLRWSWAISPQTRSQAQVYWTRDKESQRNPDGNTLLETASRQLGLREMLTHDLSSTQRLEFGLSARQVQETRAQSSIWDFGTGTLAPGLVPVAQFSRSSLQTGGYLQDTVELLDDRFKITAGGRWDRYAATGQTVFLPHLDTSYDLRPDTKLTAAFGQYAQFPTLENLYGEFGTPDLRAERSTQEMLSVDHFFSERVRLHVELYNRSESDVIYSPATQFRLLDSGAYAFPQLGSVLSNNLVGYARGVEVSLQRRSANGLSGWISYSRSYNRYRQPGTSVDFWGDNDQRNTFTAYGSLRLSPTLSVSASVRYGSGTPVPGYLSTLGLAAPPLQAGSPGGGAGGPLSAFALSSSQNGYRLPSYSRVDLRLNKVIYGERLKATIYTEVANIFGHKNWRYADYAYPQSGADPVVYATRNNTMPLLPTAGFSIEF
ncbi:MAG: carboxypeptidase regulatory-like domain-containing protein [Pseudomonadota bacterium]